MQTIKSLVSLCVEVARLQPSVKRGQAAQWAIDAWIKGGNVPDAIIRLQAAPSTATAVFSFGCGTQDGTASCDLGAMDADSQARQLEATLTVPASDTSVQAASLTVTGSAAYLPKDPAASATVTLTSVSTSATSTPTTTTSPLAVGSLPNIPTPGSTLSPGGNAAGLFPTLNPSGSGGTAGRTNVSKLADTSALPEGAPVVGAQLVGLAALGLAFVLAVTRLSIRRRPGQQLPDDPWAEEEKKASPAAATPPAKSAMSAPSATPATPETPPKASEAPAAPETPANAIEPTPEAVRFPLDADPETLPGSFRPVADPEEDQ